MTDNHDLNFSSIQAVLTSNSVELHAAEVHGVLSGLIAAGYSFESTDYFKLLCDMFNNGDSFPNQVHNALKNVYGDIWQNILDDNYSFQLLLPDDDDSLQERSHALGKWVQGFNLGFGLQKNNSATYSDDVKEVLSDFSEIANLSDEMDEDEASEQAYYEIAEYVRISVLLCFTELGSPPIPQTTKTPIH